jgi:putative ABC transport system substrate-binding protein
MRRRDLLCLLGATIAARPVQGYAASSSPAVVAWLSSLQPSHSVTLPFLLKGLAETGYIEGRNLTIRDASAENHPEQFPERAAEVVNEGVSLIAAVSGLPSIEAAKAHTSTIPIVFITLGDPVASGLIQSFNRPGGNLTGIANTGTLMVAKQIEILNELVPGDTPFAWAYST